MAPRRPDPPLLEHGADDFPCYTAAFSEDLDRIEDMLQDIAEQTGSEAAGSKGESVRVALDKPWDIPHIQIQVHNAGTVEIGWIRPNAHVKGGQLDVLELEGHVAGDH